MNEDMEVAVTVTPEDMEFRALARAAGLPDIVVSMYGTALRRLVADEREACAKVCDKWHRLAQQFETSHRTHSYIMGKGAAVCAHNIRARSQS
jgi:hypothetical protein